MVKHCYLVSSQILNNMDRFCFLEKKAAKAYIINCLLENNQYLFDVENEEELYTKALEMSLFHIEELEFRE
jgi:hypothetical protein